ncbi:hypothetical protein Pfl04_45810 [Planosporangium flavigriseum]|uniref:Uncharacterized protein n=1 Tax=Planosporangium flavigriseum TaxID=373681 RepID=A0A8J3LQL0_9ACTN|nr:hypothetical protein Pfl04_45810 [Planosporangium flavigriseum]
MIVNGALKPPSGGSIVMIIAVVVGALTVVGAGLLIGMVVRNRPDAEEISADTLTAES